MAAKVRVSEVKTLASNFEELKIQMVYREANMSSKYVANLRSSRFRNEVVHPTPELVLHRLLSGGCHLPTLRLACIRNTWKA